MAQALAPGDRVLVTGCSGRLGRFVVQALHGAGYDVVGVDRVAPEHEAPGRFVLADVADLHAMTDSAKGCAALVHLAALPDPHAGSAQEVFSLNTQMTCSAVLAAKAATTARFVLASSQAALGLAWARTLRSPRYAPIDEAHPLEPEETYGLSKVVSEDLCRMFSRDDRSAGIALRFPAIWDADQFASAVHRRTADPVQAAKSNWAYVDGRDAGEAVVAALSAPLVGFKVYNIAAPEVFAAEASAELVRTWYSDCAGSHHLVGREAVFSSKAAERDLGFKARYLWSPDGVRDARG